MKGCEHKENNFTEYTLSVMESPVVPDGELDGKKCWAHQDSPSEIDHYGVLVMCNECGEVMKWEGHGSRYVDKVQVLRMIEDVI